MTDLEARNRIRWAKILTDTHEYLKRNQNKWISLSDLSDKIFPGVLVTYFYHEVIKILEYGNYVEVREMKNHAGEKYGIALYECKYTEPIE